MTREERHEWHVALNAYNKIGGDWQSWMYEAKDAASEVPRLAMLFAKERNGELAQTHRQCHRCEPEPVPENHLSCCLGVKCRECPHLLALDAMNATPEAIDEAKAWTCATHIIGKGGDFAKEGYITTVDDRMFWDRVYEHMSMSDPDGEPEDAQG